MKGSKISFKLAKFFCSSDHLGFSDVILCTNSDTQDLLWIQNIADNRNIVGYHETLQDTNLFLYVWFLKLFTLCKWFIVVRSI